MSTRGLKRHWTKRPNGGPALDAVGKAKRKRPGKTTPSSGPARKGGRRNSLCPVLLRAASQTASATANASANGRHALMNSRSRRICANRIAYEFSHPRLDLFVAEFRIWVATSRRRHAANKPAHRFHRSGKRSRLKQFQDRLGASVANSPRRNWKWKVYFSALRPVRAAEKRSLFSEWISLDKRAAIVDKYHHELREPSCCHPASRSFAMAKRKNVRYPKLPRQALRPIGGWLGHLRREIFPRAVAVPGVAVTAMLDQAPRRK
jgi:hypothetical protein